MVAVVQRDIQPRTAEQLREHYEVEKGLAERLRDSTKEARKYLYTTLYDELFRVIPHHPQLTRKVDAEAVAWVVQQRMQLLRKVLQPNLTFLEIGAGDCSLSLEVAKHACKVYAVDVSTGITSNLDTPENFELVISDGCSIPVEESSVDIAYSHQLMEHLHPDDAVEQLQNIYLALAPGGKYICITPNRLSGPHDISRYFDEVATGFHLKEYTITELYALFDQAGFSKVFWIKNNGKVHLEIPLNRLMLALVAIAEGLLEKFPYSLRKAIANTPMLFRGMTIVGVK